MTFSDYLLDSVLILLVVRQIRESRLDLRAILVPLGILAIVAHSYLGSFPTAGNDLALTLVLTGIGVTLGVGSALATRVRSDGGRYPLVKAGWISAGLWVLGMGSRMAFSVWANNGGSATLAHFSVEHNITSGAAWTTALVMMAIGEVVSRGAVLYIRGRAVTAASSPATRVPVAA